MKYRSIFAAVVIVSIALRVFSVLDYSFPFTMDLAHDVIDIRRIAIEHDLLLIGPPTSLPGLFHGPFWFYFNLIPFVIGNGDPSYLVYWIILWFIAAGVYIWRSNAKQPRFAFVMSTLFLLHPQMLGKSRFALNSNFMPIIAVIFIALLVRYRETKARYILFMLGIVSGIALQVESGFGIMYVTFLGLVMLLLRTKIREVFISASGFIITLIPQFIFELRHDFLMTRSFLHEMLGSGETLGDELNLVQRINIHAETYLQTIGVTFALSVPIAILILLFIIIVIRRGYGSGKLEATRWHYFIFSLGFIVFSFVAYMLYPFPLKGWFMNSLYVPLIFIIAVFITHLLENGDFIIKLVVATIFVLALFNGVFYFLQFSKQEQVESNDPSVLKNEMATVDWVYQHADGEGFKVYNYMPSVIDYPYQYLFSWYGESKYGYHPDTVTYLDGVPEYIPNNNYHFDKRKQVEASYHTYLIIEPDENNSRKELWLNNFSNLCIEESHTFPWGTEVQKRGECMSPTTSTTTTTKSSS